MSCEVDHTPAIIVPALGSGVPNRGLSRACNTAKVVHIGTLSWGEVLGRTPSRKRALNISTYYDLRNPGLDQIACLE